MIIAWLLTPIGRYVAIALVAVAIAGGLYMKIRSDAVAEYEAKAIAEQLRRTDNAIRAGDAVNISPDRLRDADRNARD